MSGSLTYEELYLEGGTHRLCKRTKVEKRPKAKRIFAVDSFRSVELLLHIENQRQYAERVILPCEVLPNQ
jgi:hypothetical protein